ncbi:hypothetical protein ASF48_10460 [Rathayibacter sp. Leaf299]|uniref:hypothetical protein n=1 Tax=Rathayibacter sp. Leaf299 TaxID=1736328 RepID=UPI0006F304E4|nr:hypothetical protein [Rathayibacter sp. Leaf299]KQQ20967.1 hypothetical protein ASF48_10460 [Rathayibacter sp. Leaf299]
MDDAVDTLLSGPRGRRLCLEVAMRADPAVRTAAFLASLAIDQGTSARFTSSDGDLGESEAPDPEPEEVAAAIEALPGGAVPDDVLREGLCASVDSAWYWQEADGQDVLASLPAVRSALVRVAEDVLASPVAAEWTRPRGSEQWAVDWRPDSGRPLPVGAAALLEEWATDLRADEELERPTDPQARFSGTWWSLPLRLLQTQSRIEDLLELVEDSAGLDAATVIPVVGGGRTLEIGSAADWAELCRAHPAEVTASRRHDWYRVTGWEGRWLIPDWQRVAADWDAVHLTTLGYLSAATRLIPVGDDHGSVIAGWAPDSTLRLTDSAREADGPRQQWVRPMGEDRWRRV